MTLSCRNRATDAPRSALTVDSPPGVYRSRKNTIIIKPNSNPKVNQEKMVIVMNDGDTGKTFVKPLRCVRGTYEYAGTIEAAEFLYGPENGGSVRNDF